MTPLFTVFKIYWHATQKHMRGAYLTLYGFGVATLLGAVAGPLLLKKIMDIVAANAENLSHVDTTTLSRTIFLLFGLYAFTRLVIWVHWRIGDRYNTLFQAGVLRDLQNYAFAHLAKHSYEFFTHKFTGSLVSNTNKFVRAYERVGDFAVFYVWSDVTMICIYTGVLFYFSPILGCILLGLIFSYMLMYTFMIPKKIAVDDAHNVSETRTTGVYADALTNIFSIKMFSHRRDEQRNFSDIVTSEYKTRLTSWQLANMQRGIQRGVLIVFELLAIGTSLYLWIQGSITAGTILLVQIYMRSTVDAVYEVAREFTKALSAATDALPMAIILEQKESIQDPAHPEKSRMSRGAIDIQNMTFAYTDSSEVFTKFSLSIPAGQKVGLVGHSGSGKTTITKLLLRFVDVQSGVITIDGQDIRNVTQDDLRRAIAYVPQEPLLFHRSIAENIAYGKDGATHNEVETVAKRAHAHDFITKLHDGYATLVGERGVRLSGGERQRVAIARAMIKDAPILILDEATSALDSLSERHIQEAFDEAMRGRTTLVIAHRLSTIQKMDRIVVFNEGAIVEDGTHTELLNKGGVYATLWREQAGGFIE